jgi:hypothetical protein
MQALLRAVVETRNSGQAEETSDTERDLIIISRRIRRIGVPDALLDIVIVEERNEVTCGVTVGAENIGFHLLAKYIHAYDFRRRREPFYDRLEIEIKRVVQSRINTDHVGALRGGAPDEARDLLFGVTHENFAEGEEVLFADAERRCSPPTLTSAQTP